MISPDFLETPSICCLNLRKDMNLRNSKSNYEKKIHLSLKNVKSFERKKRKLLQSNENIQQKKILEKTPKICLNDSSNFELNESLVTSTPVPYEIRNRRASLRLQNLNHESAGRKNPTAKILYPVTSTPVQQTLMETLTTKAKEQESDYSSKKRIVRKKISQTSFLIPVESVTQNTTSRNNKSTQLSSRCSMTLRSQHSQESYNRSSKSNVDLQSWITNETSNDDSCSEYQHSQEVSNYSSSSKSTSSLQSHLSQKISHRLSSNHSMILRSHSSYNEQEVETVKTRKSRTSSKDQTDHAMQNSALRNNLRKKAQKYVGSTKRHHSSKQICKNLATSSKRSLISPKTVATTDCTKPSDCKQKPMVLKGMQKTASKEKILASTSFAGRVEVDDLLLASNIFRVRKVKSANFKKPGKNTLKRKRDIMNALKKADESYQDDIYESKTFDKFKELLMDTSDSEISFAAVSTPKLGFQVTPRIPHKTPKFRDCFSPTEYAVSRKVAEEYMHRCKNKKRASQPPVTPPVVPEKKKLEFSQIIADAQKVQETCEKLISDDDHDNDNSYFSLC